MKNNLKVQITRLFPLFVALAFTLAPAGVSRAGGPWYVALGGEDSNTCLSPSSPCATINGAIGKANEGDTIYIAQGTYSGTGSEVILLDKGLTLSGGWDTGFTSQKGFATIDGQNTRQGILIPYNPTPVAISIDRFIIKNGYAERGAGIQNEGLSVLTITNTTIEQNNAFAYQGGAIFSDGNLSLDLCLIEDNISSDGGGIFTRATTVINHSAINFNTSRQHGGGIFNEGTMTLYNSVIQGNQASGYGGGISNNGTLNINNSTISGNTANGFGGGVIVWGTRNGNYHNVTISANTANLGGGGIFNYGVSSVTNTIISSNTSPEGPDCYGSLNSIGYSLISNTSACTYTAGTGDLPNISANLGGLIGPSSESQYHPLLPGSPAINAGDPTGCKDAVGAILLSDQRGASRMGVCDMGAYEFGGTRVALSASTNPSGPGQAVTFTAQIVEDEDTTPTGSVTFAYEGGILGSSSLDGTGKAVLAVNTLSLGSHTLTATYSGDLNFAGSVSPELNHDVKHILCLPVVFKPVVP